MCNMGKTRRSLNLENSKSIQQVVVVVKAVEMLETLLNMVERARKFHYLQTFTGDVEKAGTRKDRIVKQWKQSVEAVEQKDILSKSV